MTQDWGEGTLEIINYGRFINQFHRISLDRYNNSKRLTKKSVDKNDYIQLKGAFGEFRVAIIIIVPRETPRIVNIKTHENVNNQVREGVLVV